jgi:hypothetical protein
MEITINDDHWKRIGFDELYLLGDEDDEDEDDVVRYLQGLELADLLELLEEEEDEGWYNPGLFRQI